MDLNLRAFAARMAVDVGERFLHDTEECSLHVCREAAEVGREFQLNVDLAALGKTLDVPAQSRGQSQLIEQGRVKQVGDGAQFLGELLNQLETLANAAGNLGM